MPKGSPGKDSSENIQLEPLSRTPLSRRNESIDPAEIDAKAPLRHARKCDLGMCNFLLYFVKFLLYVAKYICMLDMLMISVINKI